MEFYNYQPLPNNRMIRLLELAPCPTEGHRFFNYTLDSTTSEGICPPVACKIEEVSVEDHPVYDALSYNWGDASLQSTLICDGAPLQVSRNLYLALNRFRHQRRTRRPILLWVDAICINQHDIEERNSQVRIMRQIYQNAECVAIWLGEESQDSRLGFMLVPRLLRGAGLQMIAGDTRQAVEIPPFQFMRYYGELNQPWARSVVAFLVFSSRPWFRRVWIIQEVSVSKSAVLVCGSSRVAWNDFVLAVKCCVRFGFDALLADHSRLSRIIRMDDLRQEIKKNQERNLEHLLFRYRDFLSTDPKDKIYSLFGLAKESDLARLNLEVNYHLQTHDLYRSLAIAFLKTRGNLDILSACRIPTEQDVTERNMIDFLPSWVPDWRLSDIGVPLLRRAFDDEHSLRFTSTNRSTYIPSFSEDGSLLCLEGHFLAQIVKVGVPVPRPSENAEVSLFSFYHYERLLGGAMESWERMISLWGHQNSTYINGESLGDAFWQTFLAGNYGAGGFEAARANYYSIRDRFPFIILKYLPPSPRFLYWLGFILTIIPVLIIDIVLLFVRCCEGRKGKSSLTEFSKRQIHIRSGGWTMAKTAEGFIALVPAGTQPGDEILLCKGGKVPLILRRTGYSWQLVGECYVHGVMQGQAFHESDCIPIWVS